MKRIFLSIGISGFILLAAALIFISQKTNAPDAPLPTFAVFEKATDEVVSRMPNPATDVPGVVMVEDQKISSVPNQATPDIYPTERPSPEVMVTVATAAEKDTIPDQWVIRFDEKSKPIEQEAYIKSLGDAVIQRIPDLNALVVNVPPPPSAIVSSENNHTVYAQVDNSIYSPPSDPYYGQQWAIEALGIGTAWAQLPLGGLESLEVAVIDSGICAEHPDLVGRVVSGWNFVDANGNTEDSFGHGCAVAGIIGANIHNAIGMAGLVPNVSILPLRVLNDQGLGTYADVASALIYAADAGMDVINLSLGGYSDSALLRDAVAYALARDVVIISAAGNTASEQILYPAAYPDVIAVGSLDSNLEISSFSARGGAIQAYAPGRQIMSLKADGSYAPVSGTSFAAPQVTGVYLLKRLLGQEVNWNGGLFGFQEADYLPPTPTESAPPNPQLAAYYESLREVIRQEGSLRVIIGLNVAFEAEHELSAQEATAQRADIEATQDGIISRLAAYEISVNATYWFIPYMALTVDENALNALIADPAVHSIQRDEAQAPDLSSSIPVVGANNAWAQGYTGSGWSVAVLDTGIDKNHPFLSGKVISEACYSSSGSGAMSACPGGVAELTGPGAGTYCNLAYAGCDHGTHVAGIVAGTNASFSGVAKGASLIGISVFHLNTCTTEGGATYNCALSWTSDQIKGLQRVYELHSQGYKIAAVNMSLGGGNYSGYCDAFNYGSAIWAHSSKPAIDVLKGVGIATVIASGNSSYTDGVGSPSCISSAITVGSTTDADAISSFSNIGSQIDLLAPGSSIYSSVPGGGYSNFNGTSMAAPHVAGAWAIMKQKFPGASVDAIETMLKNSGTLVNDHRAGGIASGMKRMRVDLALGQTTAALTSGNIVINEVNTAQRYYNTGPFVEIRNKGTSAVNMTGWVLMAWSDFGTYINDVPAQITFTFPAFTLQAGGYVTIYRGKGSNTASRLYANTVYTTADWWIDPAYAGAVALTNGVNGIDYVAWGPNTGWGPPQGTAWTGENVNLPAAYPILARDAVSTDLDITQDWVRSTSSTFGFPNSQLVAPQTGILNILELEVDAGDPIVIQVNDNDRYSNFSAVTDTLTIAVVNLRSNESEVVSLTESGVNTGIFSGSLNTVANGAKGADGDGVLNVIAGDTVQATYLDRASASGSSSNSMDTVLITGFCSAVSDVPESECASLLQIHALMGGTKWLNQSGWGVNTNICSWFGVSCDGGNTHVTGIALPNNQLSGTIPDSISLLSQLSVLDLSQNAISGLGNGMGALSGLKVLNLAQTGLSGGFPTGILSLSALETLDLSQNGLNGSLPNTLGGLSSLKQVKLDHNLFTGVIPDSIGNLSGLTVLDLSNNGLNGNLPVSMNTLTALTYLNLSHNQLAGPIPANLNNLVELYLNHNLLSGTIPNGLMSATGLVHLRLENNRLSGNLPATIGNLSALKSLNVAENALVGVVPASISNLSLLGTDGGVVDLAYNGLSASGATAIFLTSKDPDWETSQTQPPMNGNVLANGLYSGLVSYTAIPYQADGGYYQIAWDTQIAGSFARKANTANKGQVAYYVSGLLPSSTYYVKVRSYTPAHGTQANAIYSEWSPILSFNTDMAVEHGIAVYIDGLWQFHSVLATGPADHQFYFGDGSWQPLVGDWNGDAQDGIGLYKNGRFYLTNDGSYYYDFKFGPQEAGWIAISGDWDGDGSSGIGIYKDGLWYLKNQLSSGEADLIVAFAPFSRGGQPFSGDWNGDGRDEIGIYKEGRWYFVHDPLSLKNISRVEFGPQEAGWVAVIGDWDGDGMAGYGIFKEGLWRLRQSLTAGAVDMGFNFSYRGFAFGHFRGDPTLINPGAVAGNQSVEIIPTTTPSPSVTVVVTETPDASVTPDGSLPSPTPENSPTLEASPTVQISPSATLIPTETAVPTIQASPTEPLISPVPTDLPTQTSSPTLEPSPTPG
ncbi:hypothetical protein MASR2M15_28650 [Anaerolineales bacterium]